MFTQKWLLMTWQRFLTHGLTHGGIEGQRCCSAIDQKHTSSSALIFLYDQAGREARFISFLSCNLILTAFEYFSIIILDTRLLRVR